MAKKTTPIKLQTAILGKEYVNTLKVIKEKIKEVQIKAALAANKELILLYWFIGKKIAEQQELHDWGTNVIEKLAQDLQNAFPGISGFSRTSVFNMRAFYLAYEKIQQPVGFLETLPIFNIPWGHNIILLTKIKNNEQRLWYAQKIIENGWSRTMLEHWIKNNLFKREGKALSNFKQTLPSTDSDMAHQALKDPYLFDFLTLHQQHLEAELEQGLIEHIQKFLLELGQGFAFIGRQVHLEVAEKDFYIDLLFYHTKLHCYVVIELKTTEFDPRDAGQISFYLSAVDAKLKQANDNPSIGLLLCQSKKKLIVEYALRSNSNPIGVASYEVKFVESLPKKLQSSLPSVEEIEAELTKKPITRKKNTSKKGTTISLSKKRK